MTEIPRYRVMNWWETNVDDKYIRFDYWVSVIWQCNRDPCICRGD